MDTLAVQLTVPTAKPVVDLHLQVMAHAGLTSKSPIPLRESGFSMIPQGGDILHKAGTVKELAQFAGKMDDCLYREALRIVTILDNEYGADRDVDNGDGGFVLIAENVQDIALIRERYKNIGSDACEAVDVFNCSNGQYVNGFYLSNNEFGINLLMPIEIAPVELLRDLSEK